MFKPLLFCLPALGLLAACSSWDWNRLNPTYIEPAFSEGRAPVLRTLDDGRDISGYPIPSSAATSQPAPKSDSPKKETPSAGIPTGTSTGVPGQVRSPYPPYKLLDSSGMEPGSLVKDPASMKTFRLP